MMTLDDDEEREELFQQHQNDQQGIKIYSSNKENEQPVDTQSAGASYSKPSSRRNRDPSKPKRMRRKPEEIERKYKCLFPGCAKAYGELPHLNTHISDSGHGERWSKTDYLEAITNKDDNVGVGMSQDDNRDLDRQAEQGNARDAVVVPKRGREGMHGLDKIRQRDQMAKEA